MVLLNLMIGTAFADAAPLAVTNVQGFDFMGLVPFVAILVIAYFLMIRPQQKKMKQQADMIAAIRRGDRVVTSGGMIGTIYKVVSNEEVIVEIAEGVRVRMLKTSVGQVIAKTEPLGSSSASFNDGDDMNEIGFSNNGAPDDNGFKKPLKPTRSKKTSKPEGQ